MCHVLCFFASSHMDYELGLGGRIFFDDSFVYFCPSLDSLCLFYCFVRRIKVKQKKEYSVHYPWYPFKLSL